MTLPLNDLSYEDLRLLLLLNDTQSLTRTAMTLAWLTPKASRRLAHLRGIFEDDLFVRSGNSLVPTQRMAELLPRVQQAAEALERLYREDAFSLQSLDRTLVFEMVDNAAGVLLAPVIPLLHARAPKLKIHIRPAAGMTLENLWDGSSDLAFGFDIDQELPGDIRSRRLFCSRHVAVVRAGHPLTQRECGGPVSARELAAHPFVSISLPKWRSINRNIDLAWKVPNPSPILVETPYFMSVPYFLENSDAYALLPREGARLLGEHHRLCSFETLPEEIRDWNPQIMWHVRSQADFPLQWICSEISRHFAALYGGRPKSAQEAARSAATT